MTEVIYFILNISNIWNMLIRTYQKLEIKPCGLGSRIWDMEAEWRLKVITDLISWWIFGKQNRHCVMN